MNLEELLQLATRLFCVHEREKKPPQIFVTANDPGPARYLTAVLQHWPGEVFLSDLGSQILGPVDRTCSIKPEQIREIASHSPNESRIIFTGTSKGPLRTSHDKQLWALGKKERIPSACFIETWNLFRERFEADDGATYPDFIFLNDRSAFRQAIISGLPRNKIHIVGNPLFEIQEKQRNALLRKRTAGAPQKVLFVSEEIRNSWISQFRDYDEYQCLELLFSELPKSVALTIKPHPEEASEKYQGYLSRASIAETLSVDQILESFDLVIGMESTLLFELATAGAPTLSIAPIMSNSTIYKASDLVMPIHNGAQLRAILLGNVPVTQSKDLLWEGSAERIVQLLSSLAS